MHYPQYDGVYSNLSSDGSNSYNTLHLKFEKRFSHGLDFLVAYAAQKNIVSENLGGYLDFNNYQSAFGLGRAWENNGLGGYRATLEPMLRTLITAARTARWLRTTFHRS